MPGNKGEKSSDAGTLTEAMDDTDFDITGNYPF
jgi:hypothetical protein